MWPGRSEHHASGACVSLTQVWFFLSARTYPSLPRRPSQFRFVLWLPPDSERKWPSGLGVAIVDVGHQASGRADRAPTSSSPAGRPHADRVRLPETHLRAYCFASDSCGLPGPAIQTSTSRAQRAGTFSTSEASAACSARPATRPTRAQIHRKGTEDQ